MISFLDGKKTRDDILKNINSVIDDSGLKLKLVVVSVGNDDASRVYIIKREHVKSVVYNLKMLDYLKMKKKL